MPQGSILGPLFFLTYVNDLAVGLKCNVKLFADDTSLFTVVNITQDKGSMTCLPYLELMKISQGRIQHNF